MKSASCRQLRGDDLSHAEFSYAEAEPTPWYRKKWVQQLAILLAVLWGIWKLIQASPPYWYRYHCWKLTQEACQFPTIPGQFILDDTPPNPAVQNVSANVIQFQKDLWAARAKANLGTLTGPLLSGTPLFCHALQTPNRIKRVVQIYAMITPQPDGSSTISLMATSCSILDLSWIYSQPKNGLGYAFQSIDADTARFSFRPLHHITITSGLVDPKDPSVVEIHFGLDQQTSLIRIHLGDNFDSTPIPRMAIEGPSKIVDGKLSMSAGWSGFYEWPIAAPSTGK